MDKEKPEWLKSVERVEAQKVRSQCQYRQEKNKISHQEKQDEKPEWLKSVERVEAQGLSLRSRPRKACRKKWH